jgi:Carboxypeptidase regulatory-like domain
MCVFMVPISLGASGDTGVKGTLRDKLGAAVEKATVLVPTTSILSTQTDKSGTFSIAVPADGLYDVFVLAPGFAPACAKVLVKNHYWAISSPILNVDPLTVNLHGDTFDTKPPRSQRH